MAGELSAAARCTLAMMPVNENCPQYGTARLVTVDYTIERAHCWCRGPSCYHLNDATRSRSVERSSIVAPATSLDLTWFRQSTSFSDFVVIVGVFFSRATARSALTVRAFKGAVLVTISLDASARAGSHWELIGGDSGKIHIQD